MSDLSGYIRRCSKAAVRSLLLSSLSEQVRAYDAALEWRTRLSHLQEAVRDPLGPVCIS